MQCMADLKMPVDPKYSGHEYFRAQQFQLAGSLETRLAVDVDFENHLVLPCLNDFAGSSEQRFQAVEFHVLRVCSLQCNS